MSWTLPPNLPRAGNKFSQKLFQRLFALAGWKLEGTMPDRAKMVVAVAPHTSNWDFPVAICLVLGLGLRIRFIGKHTLFNPVSGWLFRRLGGSPVDRSSNHGVVQQVADEFTSSKQMIFALSPEGTRAHVERWRSGFLHIAKTADVPVLMVTLNYHRKAIKVGKLYQIDDIDSCLATIQQDAQHDAGI
ncbi:1-acyl-sn-glycerol-3-phosphate acyltransferase [Sinobacterium caligoides]|uniref:1-acyl-sn-glycerol-3-phosphate acyltransferase n=1 Tax=Sinobacterium caligoides TaxID=933926 RepID=A0A3N2DPX1_9GAMM|nr:1-acyl-sn-glycerol-3-phosphate acyltransferase [Sinobacterium caligoides]ROS01833.1 1-acyl-sn-glycerol-3-phosphate acyltransferase [Sinobacterium caligoides]